MNRSTFRAVELVALVLFTVVFAMVGLELNDSAGVLDPEGALVSSRAVLAAWKTPRVLNEVDLAFPPLPCYLAVAPAYLGLSHPALWVSAMAGAALILAGFNLCRNRLLMAGNAARTCFGVMLLLALIQPSFLADVSSGRPTILWIAPVLAFLYFLGRFGLDMQAVATARETGRLSAWMESDRYQQQRLRFLWGAALFLALAAFSSSHVLFLIPPAMVLSVFLLPAAERRDRAKVITLLMVVFLPVVASQVILAYLSWVFTGDGFFFIRNNFARQLLAQPVASAVFTGGNIGQLSSALWRVGAGLALLWPVLLYLLWRLRCWPVALLMLVPFAAGIWSEAIGRPLSSGAYFSIAPSVVIIAFAFVLAYRPPGTIRVLVVIAAFGLITAFSWRQALAGHVEGAARVWARIAWDAAGGVGHAADFADERTILSHLPPDLKPNSVLCDDAAGFVFPILYKSARPFLIRADPHFFSALAMPENYVDYIFMQVSEPNETVVDRVARHWLDLPPNRHPSFALVATSGRWELWQRQEAPEVLASEPVSLSSFHRPQ